jgi:hypothetical protein
MHIERNAAPETPATWARRAWMAPVAVALATLFGCGGGGGGAAGATPDGTPAGAQGAVPAELAGQWETILTFVPPFYEGPFGGTPQGDGSLGITLILTADGRYRHAWNSVQAYFGGNCIRTGGWDENGTVAPTGAVFTFTPAKASYIQTDTCGQFKLLDPAPVSPGTHTLTLDKDPAGWPLLRMSFPTGDIVLEKCRHCG